VKNRAVSGGTKRLSEFLRGRACNMAFQPIAVIETGKIFGFDALLMGSHGSNPRSPRFLFHQEDYPGESLLRLDAAYIGSALRQGRELAQDCRLFINIHFATLHYLSLYLDSFKCLLDDLDVNPSHIVFEISEKNDLCRAMAMEVYLREFVKLGIQVAVEDIGANFNWIHHMLYVKPSYLRVDRSITGNLDASRRKQALLRSLNMMANSLGMHLMVEGLGSPKQSRLMTEIGITYGQGPHFGNPHPAESWVNQLLSRGR
jgi:EAL domain-containing protein (putative c-di-GMP-specific phosphodiesterase class I)